MQIKEKIAALIDEDGNDGWGSACLQPQQLLLLRVEFFLGDDAGIQQFFILFQFVSVAGVIHNRYAALIVLALCNLLIDHIVDGIASLLVIKAEFEIFRRSFDSENNASSLMGHGYGVHRQAYFCKHRFAIYAIFGNGNSRLGIKLERNDPHQPRKEAKAAIHSAQESNGKIHVFQQQIQQKTNHANDQKNITR